MIFIVVNGDSERIDEIVNATIRVVELRVVVKQVSSNILSGQRSSKVHLEVGV